MRSVCANGNGGGVDEFVVVVVVELVSPWPSMRRQRARYSSSVGGFSLSRRRRLDLLLSVHGSRTLSSCNNVAATEIGASKAI